MRTLRAVVMAVIFCLWVAFLPASAATDNISVAIHYWGDVHTGMGQSYNVRVTGDSAVYIILSLHPDNEIHAVNHTDGVECSEFDGDGTTIMCYADDATDAITVSAHGTVVGPGGDEFGRSGIYGVLRVGTLADGSAGRGWILDAKYHNGGTIPSALAPGPTNYQLFIPGVNR